MVRFLFLALALFHTALAEGCPSYGEPTQVGSLDAAVLPELSGLAASRLYPETLYAVNDSSGPELVVLSLDSPGPRTVTLTGVDPSRLDLEALAVGPCGVLSESCVFVANSGGNNFRREVVEVYVVAESALEGAEATPLATLRLRYPDGPHNAEGFAVHPNGDLYLLTKEELAYGAPPATLYRLEARTWQLEPTEVHELTPIATLDLSAMTPVRVDLFSQIATDLAIRPDGSRALVLTYGDTFELEVDLAELSPGRELSEAPFRRILLERLPQQEGVSYLKGGGGFLYSSEARGLSEVALYAVRCAE